MSHQLLIVDDDDQIRTVLSEALESDTLSVRTAASGEAALEALSEGQADVVLADVRMPGMSGLEFLRVLKERDRKPSVILMTAYEDLPTVAAAMRDGAVEFLIKPLDLIQLRRTLRRVLDDLESTRGGRKRSRGTTDPSGVAEAGGEAGAEESARPQLIGRDPSMIKVFKLVGQVAATRSTVLIRGESGTGKELVARSIHALSPQREQPFVAVNCASIPETLLESELFGHVKGSFTGAVADRMGRFGLAKNGTILLDEIGDTSPEFQAKLLRVLQDGEYYPVGADRPRTAKARILAATHQDLEELVERDEFRQDLYYRLRVVEIVLPPLRDRRQDIPLLIEYLVERRSRVLGRRPPLISEESVALLVGQDWPGNVRELENCLEHAMVVAAGDVVRPEHLQVPGASDEPEQAPLSLEEAERAHIARVLDSTGGTKSRAASILGISRPRLDRLIRKYGLPMPRDSRD